MSIRKCYVLFAVLMLTPCLLSAQNLFLKPESVAFDTVHNQYLVSNVTDGAIIALAPDGTQTPWYTGLGSCASNCIKGDTLFVSLFGSPSLVGINTVTKGIDFVWPYPTASGTDGLTTDTSGYLYGVAPAIRTIYKIKISDGSHTVLVNTGLAPSPQDIVFDARHNRLLVCSYTTNVPLIAVDCIDGSLDTLVVTPTSGHDGITMDPNGCVYLGCGPTGMVYKYDSTFTNPPELIASGYSHIAGIDFNWRDSVLAIPDFNGNIVDLLDFRLPGLSLVGYTLDDSGGDADGHADVNESVELSIVIENTGHEAYNVAADLVTSDSYVTVDQPTIDFGTSMARGSQESGGSMFGLTIDPSCPDPHIVELEVVITSDGGYSFNETILLYVGETPGFTDDVESGEGYWMHDVITPGFVDQWHLEVSQTHSGAFSWKAGGPSTGNYSNKHDAGLVTQPVLLDDESKLTFWHWMEVEEDAAPGMAWDGGVVMISSGDGNWTQIEPVGGYSHETVENPASPFETGTPCFSGIHGWEEVEFDLTGYSGVVQFMFRFGTDAAAGMEGWYIDDVVIERAGCCGLYNEGYTGNVNNSTDGKITLSDITVLIDHVYISKAPLLCPEDGNANGSVDGKATLSDITVMIDNVYISKELTAECL